MKIHNIQLKSVLEIKNLSLAIGNFDGLHLGHQKVINKLIEQSNKLNTESAILSFIPHPRQYFSGDDKNLPVNFALSISSHGIGLSPWIFLSVS